MPHQKGLTGIVCPLKVEASPLLKWEPSAISFQKRGLLWRQLSSPCSIVIVRSGVGAEKAQKATRDLIELHSPDRVINFGTAAALHPSLKIGDLVVSLDAVTDSAEKAAAILSPMLQELTQCLSSYDHVHMGRVLTVTQVLDSSSERESLFQKHKALCVDMESAHVLQVCAEYRVPACAVRVISDRGNNGAREEFLQNYRHTLESASSLLKNCLKSEQEPAPTDSVLDD